MPYGILCHCDKSFTLEEFQQSMTMLMTLKPYVKDHNDYICFSYFGHDRVISNMTWMSCQLHPNLTITRFSWHVAPMWKPPLTRQSCHYAMWQDVHWRDIHVIELYNHMWTIYHCHVINKIIPFLFWNTFLHEISLSHL